MHVSATTRGNGVKVAGATGAAIALALLAVYLIWGSTYLAIAVAIETMPPFLMAGSRFLVAGALLYGFLRLRGGPAPTRLHWRSAAILGALFLLAGNGGVTWAQQRVPSGLTALLIAVVPLWMVLLEWARSGGARPTRSVILGLGLGIAGLLILIGPGSFAGGSGIDPLGALVLLGGTFCWATASVHSARFPLPGSALQATAMQMLAGGLFLTLLGTGLGEGGRLDLGAVSMRSWASWIFLIFVGAIVAYSCYTWLLRVTTPAVVGTYALVNPVVAVALGAWLLAEPVTLRTILAALVILAGVGVIMWVRARGTTMGQRVGRAAAKSRALLADVPRRMVLLVWPKA